MSSAPINPEWRIHPFDLNSLYHSPALYMIVETLLWEDWKFNLYPISDNKCDIHGNM